MKGLVMKRNQSPTHPRETDSHVKETVETKAKRWEQPGIT